MVRRNKNDKIREVGIEDVEGRNWKDFKKRK
jgi:hypothetical protein